MILGIVVWSLNFIPPPRSPKDCEIIAEISWAEPLDGILTPLYVELTADEPVRYTVGNGRPLALLVPGAEVKSAAQNRIRYTPFCALGFKRRSSDNELCPVASSAAAALIVSGGSLRGGRSRNLRQLPISCDGRQSARLCRQSRRL